LIQIDIAQMDFENTVFFIDRMCSIGAKVHQHLVDMGGIGLNNLGIFFNVLLN
jgi:hypothetical protein